MPFNIEAVCDLPGTCRSWNWLPSMGIFLSGDIVFSWMQEISKLLGKILVGQIEFLKDSLGLESTKCYQIMLFFLSHKWRFID